MNHYTYMRQVERERRRRAMEIFVAILAAICWTPAALYLAGILMGY